MNSLCYLPIVLDLSKFSILIIGGGNVAYRKAKTILESGGRFNALAMEFIPEYIDLMQKEKIEYKIKKFEKGDISNHQLVFSCTNDRATNKSIYTEALKNSALINVVDEPELCTFIMPAIIRRGHLLISVSTQGQAPFLAKELKDSLDNFLSPILAEVVQLAENFRKNVMGIENLSEHSKKFLYNKFLEYNWQKIIYEMGYDYALNISNDLIKSNFDEINSL